MRWERSLAIATGTVILLAGCANGLHADAVSDSLWRSSRRRIEFSAQLGGLRPANNPGRLEGATGGAALGIGIGYDVRPQFAIDLELSFSAADHAAPFIATPWYIHYDERMTAHTFGVVVSGKAFRPLGPVEAYARGGVGLYRAGLTLFGTELVGVFPVPTLLEDGKTAPGLQLAGGVEVPFGEDRKRALGLEARQQWLSADLKTLAGGEARMGGQMATLTVARRSRSWLPWR